MAISRLTAQDQLGASTTTSVSATYPSTPTNGNTMIATVYANVTTGLASITGWTKLAEGAFSGTAQSIAIFAKVAGVGESTTVTASGATAATIMRMHIYEYSGLAATLTTDGSNTATSGVTSVSSLLSGSITTANANDLLFIAGATGGSATTQAFDSGFNLLQVDASAIRLFDGDQIVAATSTYSSTGSWVTALRAGNVIIALQAAVAATTTSTSSTSASTSTSISTSSTSSSTSSTSTSSTSRSTSTSSTSTSYSITTLSTSSTSSSVSSTSMSSTSSSTSISSTSSSTSLTSTSSTSTSSTSSSISMSSTSSSMSSTSSSVSSTSMSISSTSFSSTSSSSSTSTTTLPPPYINYSYDDTASYTTVIQFGITDPTSWICPANVTSVLVECWGAGGSGGSATGVHTNAGGGGGGAYANKTLTVVPGTTYAVTVGSAGASIAGGVDSVGNDGGDSWFSTSATVLAKGGLGGSISAAGGNGTGGAGGSAASSIGDVTQSGGSGGTDIDANNTGGGGGGSAGNLTVGGAGANSSAGANSAGGQQGAVVGGVGGISAGTGALGSPGRAPGGGGGGTGFASSLGPSGAGAGGLILLTYTKIGLPTTNANLANLDTAVQYSNVSADDSDYFIQFGSEYVISEFKKTFTNNSNNINIIWQGRSTEAFSISPIYLQIYNQNSSAWETLASETVVGADTNIVLIGNRTSNLSSYYDSTNTVSFRVYQQVV